MTARFYTLDLVEGFRPKTFAGHRDAVLSAYFSADGNTVSFVRFRSNPILNGFLQIYTVSKDGLSSPGKRKEHRMMKIRTKNRSRRLRMALYEMSSIGRWGVYERHYFNQQVVCSIFHAAPNPLVVGFSTGAFGLWEMPSFSNIHTLSISQEKISSVAISPSGEWLAFGARKLGQLLV